MLFVLVTAGIVAGLVNYFYVYLTLPVEKKKPEHALAEVDIPDWELPRLSFWLVLCGYIIIALAGAFLTPLVNAILHLAGLSPALDLATSNEKWVLLGYGIVFGFSANRMLSSIAEGVLARIEAVLKAKEAQQRAQAGLRGGIRTEAATWGGPADASAAAPEAAAWRDLNPGEHFPAIAEVAACGAMVAKIARDTPAFGTLKKNDNADIVFKDEEGTGADRMMSTRLFDRINTLSGKVRARWTDAGQPVYKLRVVEAWDENNEHGLNSLHYEGRAADLTLWDIQRGQPDTSQLGALTGLAIDAGFDWVFYEDSSHIHVSCKRS